MDGQFGRKGFLKAVAGAGLAGANFLYPGIAQGRGRVASVSTGSTPAADGKSLVKIDGADPGFASGAVVAKTTDGIVIQSPLGVRAIRIPAGTTVWKEFDVGPEAIELGDWTDARGTPLEDGSLLARSGWTWINIARRDGVIQEIGSASITLGHENGASTTAMLSSKLDVINAETGAGLPGQLTALKLGDHVGAVGIRLKDGNFRATRIWRNET